MPLNNLEVVTLFVHDIAVAKAFYAKVFAVEVVYFDDVSAVLGLSGAMINLLEESQAPELVEPLQPARHGVRALLTIKVADVDVECARLAQLGIDLLNGPVNRPWGRRTAAFRDPSGHVWELAQDV
ncbi:VOC family protein [Devosia sp. XK-2]|uniref:VOC family protein n=1 Tax=Devosia sp. XK-2 TaxID=3126689 RepID=UPI0030CEA21A